MVATLWLLALCCKLVSQMLHGICVHLQGLGKWPVPLSARLETRTKESMELAGLTVLSAKPQGVVKASHPRWCRLKPK